MRPDQLKLNIEAHKTTTITSHRRPTIAPWSPNWKTMATTRTICCITTMARAISPYPSRPIGTPPTSTRTQHNSSHRLAYRVINILCVQANPSSSQLTNWQWRSRIFCAGQTTDFNTCSKRVNSTILGSPSISRGRKLHLLWVVINRKFRRGLK